MILDMFKKKEEEEVTPVTKPVAEPKKEEPKGPKTPEQLEMEAKMAREKQRLERTERLLRQIYQDKKDCYLVLARGTTLDQLVTKDNLRPLIAALNKDKRLPVIRCATTEAVAADMARTFGCVCEERPMVIKISFVVLLNLMNKLAKGGLFHYVMVDGADVYVDRVAHAGYYYYKELKQEDPMPFFQYMCVLESLHAIRVGKLPLYVLPAPNTTQEQVDAHDIKLGLIGDDKMKMTPVFTTPKVAGAFMKKWNADLKLARVDPMQLKTMLKDMQTRFQGKDFPVFFGGLQASYMVSGNRFLETMDEVFVMPK